VKRGKSTGGFVGFLMFGGMNSTFRQQAEHET
jgi:hypothetical protein